MSELRINNITDRAGSSDPIIAGISTVTSTSHMVMLDTEMRGGRGGIIAGGYANPSFLNSMEFIQISTTGNSTDFGDMSEFPKKSYQHHQFVVLYLVDKHRHHLTSPNIYGICNHII